MREREDVLREFGVVTHTPLPLPLVSMADEIVRLRALIERGANAWLDLQRDRPIAWEGGLDDAMIAACAEIRALAAAPRVRVLDEWRVLTKDGEDPKRTWWITHEWAVEDAASADKEYPADAPHRVVRVALVEESTDA